MKTRIVLMTAVLLSACTSSFAQQRRIAGEWAPNVSGGLSMGYDIGMPIQGRLTVADLAEGFPLAFRLSISHSFMLDGGSPEEARQVFINENANGVPTKSAGRWAFGLDLMHRVNLLAMRRAYAYAGVYYSRFTSSFDFIGGNEFFDVHSNQWGLGAGLEGQFRMNPRIDLVCSVGAEYFFPGTLEGHDAAYKANGEMINQREDYTYEDADRAINQPKLQPKLLIGMNYRF